jgi:hypothetical protein
MVWDFPLGNVKSRAASSCGLDDQWQFLLAFHAFLAKRYLNRMTLLALDFLFLAASIAVNIEKCAFGTLYA